MSFSSASVGSISALPELNEDLDGLFAQHEAGEVEIVDGHVLEDAARCLQVFARGKARVTGRDDHLADLADLAGTGPIARGPVARIVAAVEADLDRPVEAL